MFDALYIGATGMQAQQLNVDTIANNLVNLNTVGFKRARVNFSNLVAQDPSQTSRSALDESNAVAEPMLARVGMGVAAVDISRSFEAGSMQQTSSALDLAIMGDGFFEVTAADGGRAFIRGGTLMVNKDGLLATQSGLPLKPGIQVPANMKSMTIAADGTVQMTILGQTNPVEAGQLELVRFASPALLQQDTAGVFRATDKSGDPQLTKAGENGAGTVAQGYLEGSNVKMVDEMVNMIVAQRAYEASVKIVQASDEMLGMINNLRR